MRLNYSVPYEYVGKRVEVRQTNSIVEIYYKGTRICSHARLHGRANQYSTNNNHVPKTISYLNGIKKDLKNGQKGLEKTLTKSFIDLSVDIRLRSSLIKVVYHY